MTIGESLKRFRSDFNLSQTQVSNSVGIMQQAYGRYELDKNIPSAEVIIRIANAFDVSTDYLLGRSDIPKLPKISDADNELVESVIACKKALQKVLDNRGIDI